MSSGEIIAIVIAVSGILVAVINAAGSARKTEVETLRALIETVQGENERLRQRVNELETENGKLRCEVDELRRQLDAERTRPRPSPRTGGRKGDA